MAAELIKSASRSLSVGDFVRAASVVPVRKPQPKARLVFAFDATASRQPTRDLAAKLQAEMLASSKEQNLEVAIGFYRGLKECKITDRFFDDGQKLESLMLNVSCITGATQIEKLLNGILAKKEQGVKAAVFVGDAFEESHRLDEIVETAKKLKSAGIPVFMFQEGHDENTASAFAAIAAATGGLHAQFDHNSAQQLKDYLQAISAYATGANFGKLSSSSANGQKLIAALQALPAPN